MMLPVMTDIKTWAASLVVDFPNSNIPFLADEKNWKTWGNTLVQTTDFVANAAPGTAGYEEPEKWMQAVFKSMSNY